tara:strand:+ start:77 stop:1033 length:957 start_codon:yes stop_codon:yes gene_type:complete
MRNKEIIFISIVILLCSLLFFKKNKISSFNTQLFSVTDTISINKIIISDRYDNEIELKRNKNLWIVNDSYLVRKDAIKTLLSTLKNIRIKNLLSNDIEKNIEKQISTLGVGVIIYNNNKKINSFIVGPSTSDHLGTYIYHLKTKKTYSTHIPGFNGFLSPRFGIQANRIEINNWRNPTLIDYKPSFIDSIYSNNFSNSSKSFKLICGKENNIKNYQNKTIKNVNYGTLNLFLNSFTNLNVEKYLNDSLKNNLINPYKELIIYSKNNIDSIVFYTLNSEQDDDTKNYNIKRKIAVKNNEDICLVQDYVFNKVLINIDDF